MRWLLPVEIVLTAGLLGACVGGNGTHAAAGSPPPPPPVLNTMTLTVDAGPAAAGGAINHAYVTVKVCAHGSATQCANIDHILLDTGSWGLRLVGSVLAANQVALTNETDSSNRTIERMRDVRRRSDLGTGGPGRCHAGRGDCGRSAGPGTGRYPGLRTAAARLWGQRHPDQLGSGLRCQWRTGGRRVRPGLWRQLRERRHSRGAVLRLHGRRGRGLHG